MAAAIKTAFSYSRLLDSQVYCFLARMANALIANLGPAYL